MPHYKCVACRTRLHRGGSPADDVGDLCPGCGCLLEPVGDLSEIVGFQSIRSRDHASASGFHQRLAESIGDFVALRDAIRAQAKRDAEQWIDVGGSFNPEAVAQAVARPTPKENS